MFSKTMQCRMGAALAISAATMFATSAVAVAETGVLVEHHGDTLRGTEVGVTYALRTATGERPLSGAQPESLLGQRVTDGTTGRDLRAAAVRATGSARVRTPPKSGPQSVLVILGTLSDERDRPFSPDDARRAIFTDPVTSAAALFSQQSQGLTGLTGRQRADGDVAGWFDLPTSSAGCDYGAISAAGDAAARTAGFEPDAYDHVIYLFPTVGSCSWAGLGDLPGRRVWSNGYLDAGVIAHELGHNMGAHHASALSCRGTDGAPVALSGDCSASEYGDPFDVMGVGWHSLMSGWHRAQVGQLAPTAVQTVRETGAYDLTALDDPAAGNGVRTLLVPMKESRVPVSGYLALELRGAGAPFDAYAPDAPVTTGLTIRRVPRLTTLTQSGLVDTTPGTPTLTDAPLAPGGDLVDDAHGIRVHLTRVENGHATVEVFMPRLVDDVPPSAPEDGTAVGTTRSVTLTWDPATDDEALDHYEVFRDGQLLATTPSTEFVDTALAGRERVTYGITAVDTSGNRADAQPLTLSLTDGVAPVEPRLLSAHRVTGGMRLTWSPGVDDRGVAAYLVLRDGRTVTRTLQRTFTDRTARAGTHRWSVVSMDRAGNRSAPRTTLGVIPRRGRRR